jgi:hypothetical protein
MSDTLNPQDIGVRKNLTQAEVREAVIADVKLNLSWVVRGLEKLDPKERRAFDVDSDDISSLNQSLDYRNAAERAGFSVLLADPKVDGGTGYYYIKENEASDEAADESSDGERSAELYDTRQDAWQAACKAGNITPDERDVFEWYAVSDSLAFDLAEEGETVVELHNWHVWLRGSTGQMVHMDSVIGQVYNRKLRNVE